MRSEESTGCDFQRDLRALAEGITDDDKTPSRFGTSILQRSAFTHACTWVTRGVKEVCTAERRIQVSELFRQGGPAVIRSRRAYRRGF